MNKIQLYYKYEWDDNQISFCSKTLSIKNFLSIVEQLKNYNINRFVKIDNKELNVNLKENKRNVDYFYEINGLEYIPSDIGIINYLIKDNIDTNMIKKFEHQGCNWLVFKDTAMLYDNEHARYGKWSLSELININADSNKILNIQGGNFVPNKIKHPDVPSLKNIVSLEGERIYNGYYKKRFCRIAKYFENISELKLYIKQVIFFICLFLFLQTFQ